MAKLRMEIEKQEQNGSDTDLKIKLSESPEDGDKSTIVKLTLHDVKNDTVIKEQGGILFYNADGAPCILRISAPLSSQM